MAKSSGNRNLCLSIIVGVVLNTYWASRATALSTGTCTTFLGNCFVEVSANLQCHTDIVKGDICKTKDAKHLCQSFEYAINCTLSVMDMGCGFAEGALEAWTDGLKGILAKLCVDDYSLVQNLIDIPNCWNVGRFLSCTEEKVGITHLVDLISTPLDVEECNLLMVSLALCNAKAEMKRYLCRESASAVVHAVTAFFAKSSCMNQMTKELVSEHCESQARFRAGVSAILSLIMAALLVAAGTFYLARRRIIIINRRFRLREGDDKDAIIC